MDGLFRRYFAVSLSILFLAVGFLSTLLLRFVGEYARKKIKHIIERLLPGGYFLDDSEAEYHLLMELIGDPFLKMQLQQLYEDRRKRNGKD